MAYTEDGLGEKAHRVQNKAIEIIGEELEREFNPKRYSCLDTDMWFEHIRETYDICFIFTCPEKTLEFLEVIEELGLSVNISDIKDYENSDTLDTEFRLHISPVENPV